MEINTRILINLENVERFIQRIDAYFEGVQSPEDFTKSMEGFKTHDAISMLLCAIGETIKRIDSISNQEYLQNYANVDWKSVMRMRDLLSHHYEKADAIIVYQTCLIHLQPMKHLVRQMIEELQPPGAPRP